MRRPSAILCAVVVLLPPLAHALDNRVAVQSANVLTGYAVQFGVYVENNVDLNGVVIPLVFRSTSGGAYPSAVTAYFNLESRIAASLGCVQATNIYGDEDGSCKNGQPGGFGTVTVAGGLSANWAGTADPDAFQFNWHNIFCQPIWAGTDFPIGSGEPCFAFQVLAGPNAGTFAIDTTCVDPAGHLVFINSSNATITDVSFTGSSVTVTACQCPFQGDYDESGFLDAVDLNLFIDDLFFGAESPQDPQCPTTRGDFNYDGFPDAVDLNALIDHLFFGGTPPCDPCNQVQASCAH